LIGRSNWLVLATTICLLCCGCQTQRTEHVQAFQRALDRFDAAKTPQDYLQCAAIYQEIIDSGTVSGAVYFNQGNAFAKANQKGRAIASYRQALKYRPNDRYLKTSLKNIAGDAIERKPLIEHLCFWQNWISYPLKFQLAFGFLLITLVAALLRTYWALLKDADQFLWLRKVAMVSGALAIVALGSVAYDWYRFDYLERGVIVQNNVVARKGNSSTYEPAFQTPLEETTEFIVEETRNEWALIRLENGHTGWVPLTSIVVY
jgi:tetratricopeptide (TPR) repeat protein